VWWLVLAIVGALAIASTGGAAPRKLPKDRTKCFGLTPTHSGTAGPDFITGKKGRDVIQAGGGDDHIRGLGGNDVICAGSGDDVVSGGGGNDKIDAGLGRDTVSGDAGNDRIFGRSDADKLSGGPGADRLSGQAGSDTVLGDAGGDIATGGPGRDTVRGGAGNDRLGGGRGSDTVDGGVGDDKSYGGPGHDTLDPGPGADEVFGGRGADDILPGDGGEKIVPDPIDGTSDPGDPSLLPGEDVTVPDPSAEALLGPDSDRSDLTPPADWADHVDPGGGDDTVMGSPGDDTVSASDGNDKIAGGDGNDSLQGGDGADTVDGGEGVDAIDGGAGNDPALNGGAGNDKIDGAGGDDHADGGPGADMMNGGPGADTLQGGVGGDDLTGGPDDASDGADILTGGDSVDTLTGGAGGDTLSGGPGSDALFGGSGDDTIDAGDASDDAYGQAGANDTCVQAEQNFGCENTVPGGDEAVPRDAPSAGGACDAWAANSGDDQGAGTAASPYRTVERLVNALRPGETGCLVGGQIFEEPDFEIHVLGGGDPGNPITIKTGPGPGSGAEPRATVKGRLWIDQQAQDIVFEDLVLDGENPLATLRGAGAALPSPTINGDRVSFIGNDITTNRASTCLAVGSFEGFGAADATTISGNRVHACGVPTTPSQNSGDNGIDIEGSTGAAISNNYVYDNADRGVLIFGDGQNSQISDNVITANRIGVHVGTAIHNGVEILPNGNTFTNNVIAADTLARDNESWEVEGFEEDPSPPHPTGNVVDFNCIWNQDPAHELQSPPLAWTDGGHNTLHPPNGPGFSDAAAADFRLVGGPGQCARSFGPQDPPTVTTEDPGRSGTGVTVGYSVTDHSRSSGSSVWIEYRRDGGIGTDGQATAPAQVAVGDTASARVALAGLADGTTYRYRAVAHSASGFVYGPEKTFTTSAPPGKLSGPPAPGDTTVNLYPAPDARVKVRLKELERFYTMSRAAQVPLRSSVDATLGSVGVRLGGALGQSSITAGGGVFLIGGQVRGLADLRLTKDLRCGSRKKSRGGADTNPLRVSYRRGNRKISVSGHFATAVPSRTSTFTVAELCQGTRVSVSSGAVLVKGPKGQRPETVRAGHAVLRRGNR
jgi:parallel beta-helix repeat protein